MSQRATRGKVKRYGPKMANPRISASKENRNCGPLGRYRSWQLWLSNPDKFQRPTLMPVLYPHTTKVGKVE